MITLISLLWTKLLAVLLLSVATPRWLQERFWFRALLLSSLQQLALVRWEGRHEGQHLQ